MGDAIDDALDEEGQEELEEQVVNQILDEIGVNLGDEVPEVFLFLSILPFLLYANMMYV